MFNLEVDVRARQRVGRHDGCHQLKRRTHRHVAGRHREPVVVVVVVIHLYMFRALPHLHRMFQLIAGIGCHSDVDFIIFIRRRLADLHGAVLNARGDVHSIDAGSRPALQHATGSRMGDSPVSYRTHRRAVLPHEAAASFKHFFTRFFRIHPLRIIHIDGHQVSATIEHISHVFPRLLVAETAQVERGQALTAIEHINHGRILACVETAQVERCQLLAAFEHRFHVLHFACVETAQVERGQALTAIEHVTHLRHVRSIKLVIQTELNQS